MMLWMLAAQAMTLAAVQTAATATPPADVVVMGPRLSALKDRLDACLARRCPPREDVAASLAYAKEQFLSGDYAASRETLSKSRGRNRQYAAKIPQEVSWVHHGLGTMKGLTGYVDDEKASMIAATDALKAGLASDDARVLLSRLDIANAYTHARRTDEAIGVYASVIRAARRAHLPVVEGLALFRQAVVLASLASVDGTYRPAALTAAQALQQTSDPALLPIRQAGQVVALQFIADEDRRLAAIDAAIAHMTPIAFDTPFLLYAPRFDPATVFEKSDELGRPIWFDLTYTVTRSGRVGEASVTRQSPFANDSWKAKVMALVANRRFMPMTADKNLAGVRKIERYSFVSDIIAKTDTRVSLRAEGRRLVVTDLSDFTTNVDAGDLYAEPPL